MREAPRDSIRDFAGDDAGARVLRDGLGQLARHYAGTPLGERITDVLIGRTDMRDLAGDPELVSLTTGFTRQFAEQWDRMDPDERADLVRRGDVVLADLEPEPDRSR
ncbi:hypothetical protein [Nocardioides rubriscoriae]|uniref:hypothetical protein n=1 Tax=Nocardioides rubriscoriae TaxID=642762 RepID=UPI0011E06CBD|nr:hypothetical protein [Nocardioides rubriscoriae]